MGYKAACVSLYGVCACCAELVCGWCAAVMCMSDGSVLLRCKAVVTAAHTQPVYSPAVSTRPQGSDLRHSRMLTCQSCFRQSQQPSTSCRDCVTIKATNLAEIDCVQQPRCHLFMPMPACPDSKLAECFYCRATTLPWICVLSICCPPLLHQVLGGQLCGHHVATSGWHRR